MGALARRAGGRGLGLPAATCSATATTPTYDAAAVGLWVGAILALRRGGPEPGPGGPRRAGPPRWGWVVVFGVLAGWAADTKLTGWFLPLPFLAWTALLPRAAAGC